MNTKRLLKLADFLDRLPREKFDFGQIAQQAGKPMLEALKLGKTRCGTVACAIGWMPAVFPRGLAWCDRTNIFGKSVPDVVLRNDPDVIDFGAAQAWFALTRDQTEVLFAPDNAGFGLRPIKASAHPKVVARRIRRFVARNARMRA